MAAEAFSITNTPIEIAQVANDDNFPELQNEPEAARRILLGNMQAQKVERKDWHSLLDTGSTKMPQPFALKDSEAGARLFVKALDELSDDNKMAIWGDYDADGNTASAVLGLLARQIHPDTKNIVHHIPYREAGFGLNKKGIKELADKHVKNLFVVDSGTVAYEAISYAKSLGMHVVVLDHHQPKTGEALPEGALIINPHRLDETAKDVQMLSAAGVSWLFARDVKEELIRQGKQEEANRINYGMIDVAACLGTVTDVVPMRGLNRRIVADGLREINSGDHHAMQALKWIANKQKVTEGDIGFQFGPYLNAPGRNMDDPSLGMQLLLANDSKTVESLVKDLKAHNDERKQFTNNIITPHAKEKAAEFFKKHPGSPILMVEDHTWTGGMVGVSAGRLKEEYGLPTLVGYTWKNPDTGESCITYSARSIEGVDLHHALEEAFGKDFQKLPQGDIVKCGGHAMAAGLTIKADAKERVLEALGKELAHSVEQARKQEKIRVAAVIKPEELTLDVVKSLYKFGAYGARFSPPRLLVENVQVKNVRTMGDKEKHLRVSLGIPGESSACEGLRSGTAFWAGKADEKDPGAQTTPLGRFLQDKNRHNQVFDAVIEPYLYEKNNGEEAIGYHIISVTPARVVSHDPDPESILQASINRLEEQKTKIREEKEAIEKLPLKPADLIKELRNYTEPEVQRRLKILYDNHASLIDTETTGLKVHHQDHEKTNGLTQLAMAKPKKVTDATGGVHYELEEKNISVLPFTPAYQNYLEAKKQAIRTGAPLPAYDRSVCEYAISQEGLDVTGTEFIREGEDGPIREMRIANTTVKDPKPFYEVASEAAQFLEGTVPYAFNTQFDARGLMRQFTDVMKANSPLTPEGQPHLQIMQDTVRRDYAKKTRVLTEIYQKRDFFQYLDSPAQYCCSMLTALLELGEQSNNTLDKTAPRYNVAFSRSSTQHDAMEDVRPMAFMVPAQLEYFAGKEAQRPKERSTLPMGLFIPEPDEVIAQKTDENLKKPLTLARLYENIAQASDPGAHVATGEMRSEEKKEEERSVSSLTLHLPGGMDHGIGSYLSSLVPAQIRNTRIPKTVLVATPISIVLDADAKMGNDKVPLVGSFKNSACVSRFLKSKAVLNVRAFDSTGKIDITLKSDQGPITIEDVPLRSVRKCMDFLLQEKELPHLKEHLELIKWITDLPEVGIATMDATGIHIRGLQRGFGDITLGLPEGKNVVDAIPQIKANLKKIVSLGAVPGAVKTEYNVEEDDDDSPQAEAKAASGQHLVTQYRLDASGSVTMEVAAPLLKLVAQQKGYQFNSDNFIWPGGIVGQKSPESNNYMVHGSLDALEEVGKQLRDASWLLYRFNELPGVRKTKTKLGDDGKLVLQCSPMVPVETMWILHRAHVPFKVTRDTIEFQMPDLMHDPYHWYWEIKKDQTIVKDLLEKQKKYDEKVKEYNKEVEQYFPAKEQYDQEILKFTEADTLYKAEKKKAKAQELPEPIKPEKPKAPKEPKAPVPPSFATHMDALVAFMCTADDSAKQVLCDTINNVLNKEIEEPLTPNNILVSSGIVGKAILKKYFNKTDQLHSFLQDIQNSTPLLDAFKIPPNIEDPPAPLAAAHGMLRNHTIKGVTSNGVGAIYAQIKDYLVLPVRKDIEKKELPAIAAAGATVDSPLFEVTKDMEAVAHRGLAIRLMQMHGIQQNFSNIARDANGKIIITPPTLEPFHDSETLITEFKKMTRLAQSVHINPFLDGLRGIVQSPAMHADHAEPVDGISENTSRSVKELVQMLEPLKKHMGDTLTNNGPIGDDISGFNKNYDEVHLKDTIFQNVAEFDLIRKSLAKAREEGKLAHIPEAEYVKMQTALTEYYESLSMAEFKRYRLTLDGAILEASLERLKKVLSNTDSKVSGTYTASSATKAEKAAANANPDIYGPYKAHSDLTSAIEAVWENAKRYKRTLHFSDEIIACAAQLQDPRKRKTVADAIAQMESLEHDKIKDTLHTLKEEGGTPDFKREGNQWKIDATELDKDPGKWERLLAELQQGKKPIPKAPHVLVDTSTLLTMLLGTETFPDDKHAGNITLLEDMAAHGAIIPVITGAVLAEFLNSPVPLKPEDIFHLDAHGKALDTKKYDRQNLRHARLNKDGNPTESPVEYPKWEQRLEFLKELYNAHHVQFIETPTERLYCKEIRTQPELQKKFAELIAPPKQGDKATEAHAALMNITHDKSLEQLTDDELKQFLLTPGTARDSFIYKMRNLGLRQDIGEVSLADAIQHVHHTYGTQAPVFVLYEGDDVRGRLLRRKVLAESDTEKDTYHAGKAKDSLEAEFKPGHIRSFNRKHSEKLGNTCFLSTGGFEHGLMQMAQQQGAYIFAPDENTKGIKKILEEQQGFAGQQLNMNGRKRVYKKIVDEHASELGTSEGDSQRFTEGRPGPWQQYVQSLSASVALPILIDHLKRKVPYHAAGSSHHLTQHAEQERLLILANLQAKALQGRFAALGDATKAVETMQEKVEETLAGVTESPKIPPEEKPLSAAASLACETLKNEIKRYHNQRKTTPKAKLTVPLSIGFVMRNSTRLPADEREQVLNKVYGWLETSSGYNQNDQAEYKQILQNYMPQSLKHARR